MAFEISTRTQGEPAAYTGKSRFLPCVGLWPGQRASIGIRVIAVGTSADSPPFVVWGQHLTDSGACLVTPGHEKIIPVGHPAGPPMAVVAPNLPLDPA